MCNALHRAHQPRPAIRRPCTYAMQTAAAAADPPPDCYVTRLAGEVDENELLVEIGPAGVTLAEGDGAGNLPVAASSRLRARRRVANPGSRRRSLPSSLPRVEPGGRG